MTMITMIGVIMGAALGGMLRLWVGNRVSRHVIGYFPWGTLTVNLTAALVMGLASGVWHLSGDEPGALGWALVTVGLLGGYSTVSSLSLQVVTLWQQRRDLAVAYLVASLGGGLVLVATGHLGVVAVMA